MIILFVGSWLPYALVATFGFVGLGQLVTPYTAEIPVMLAKASAIWNPIVYALMHPRYRSTLAGYLPQCLKARCCGSVEGDSKTSSTRRSYQPATNVALQATGDRVDVDIPAAYTHHVVDDDDDGDGGGGCGGQPPDAWHSVSRL